MSEQVISVAFGRETFSSSSVSLSAFVTTAPFKRELPSKAYKRQGALQVFPASAHPDVNGNLYMDTVRVPDGVILILQCSHKQHASPILDGALILRTRATGPMLAVYASLPTSPEAINTGQFLTFQGRADRLTPEEAEEAGLELPTHWKRAYLDDEEVDECFTVNVLANETAAKPRMEVIGDGEDAIVVQARPGRRLRARRG